MDSDGEGGALSEEWETVCDFIADKDHDIRDLAQFIRKGGRVLLLRKKE